MVAITRSQYWNTLNTTKKCLLLLGLSIMSPIVVVLLLYAGSVEAFNFITKTKV